MQFVDDSIEREQIKLMRSIKFTADITKMYVGQSMFGTEMFEFAQVGKFTTPTQTLLWVKKEGLDECYEEDIEERIAEEEEDEWMNINDGERWEQDEDGNYPNHQGNRFYWC